MSNRNCLWVIEFALAGPGGGWLFKHATSTRRSAYQFKNVYECQAGREYWKYRVTKFVRAKS